MTDANGPSWMGSESILLVCTRCNRTNSDEERNGVRGGAVLLDAIRARPPDPSVRIQPIACVSACKRACAIGLMAPGKVGYLFGDLPPDASAAEAIGELAALHAAKPNGFLPRVARPPLLQAGILARLPPLAWARGDEIVWPA
jgi:predicted metal-binding protein